MNEFLKMVNIQAVLLVYLLIGFIVKRKKIINEETNKGLTELLVNVLMPCMIFESFNQVITNEQIRDALIIFIFSICISTFCIVLGGVLWRNYPKNKKGVLKYGTLISNSGFAGLPMISSAYGELGLFYASIFVIPTRVFMWSAGVSCFTDDDGDFKTKIVNVLKNPGIVAVYFGVARLITGFPLPTFVDTAIKSVGNTTTSISMIIIGFILADIDVHTVIEKSVVYLSFVRLFLIPLTIMLVLKFINIDPIAGKSAVLLTAMPVGTSTAILAQKYGADGVFGSKCVFLTTILSLFTVPIITLLLNIY